PQFIGSAVTSRQSRPQATRSVEQIVPRLRLSSLAHAAVISATATATIPNRTAGITSRAEIERKLAGAPVRPPPARAERHREADEERRPGGPAGLGDRAPAAAAPRGRHSPARAGGAAQPGARARGAGDGAAACAGGGVAAGAGAAAAAAVAAAGSGDHRA